MNANILFVIDKRLGAIHLHPLTAQHPLLLSLYIGTHYCDIHFVPPWQPPLTAGKSPHQWLLHCVLKF